MAGWIEARSWTARRLARRSAERRRIEEALRLGAADLFERENTTNDSGLMEPEKP